MKMEDVAERVKALENTILGNSDDAHDRLRSQRLSLIDEVQSIKEELQNVTLASEVSMDKVRETFKQSQQLAASITSEHILSTESKAQELIASKLEVESSMDGLETIAKLEKYVTADGLGPLTSDATVERIGAIATEQTKTRDEVDQAVKSLQTLIVNYEQTMHTISTAFVQLDTRLQQLEKKVAERKP